MLNDPENGDYSVKDGSPATGYGVQGGSSNIDELEVVKSSLIYNYPNPFNPSTTISYNLPSVGKIKIAIYNLSGEVVDLHSNSNIKNGNYRFNGENLPSGIYFANLIFNGELIERKRMVLIK